jgi:hypothetical protein
MPTRTLSAGPPGRRRQPKGGRRRQPVELQVIAKNPGTRIQIVSESRKICLPEAATSETTISLPPGQYTILYWLGSGPVNRLPVSLQEKTVIQLERAPRTSSSDGKVFYIARTPAPNHYLTVWAEALDSGKPSGKPGDFAAPDTGPTLFLGQAGLPPSEVRAPSGDSPKSTWDPFGDLHVHERRLELIVVGQSGKRRIGLRRSVPIPNGLSALVHVTRVPARGVESTRSASALEWRAARYRLHLRDLTRERESWEEFEDGEAMIDLLGESGRVSVPVTRVNAKALRNQVLASVAEWLLAARGLEWGKQGSRDFADQLFAAIPSEGPVAELPDVQLLHLLDALCLEDGGDRPTSRDKPFHLQAPVFSESWRALSRVPLANWQRRPILVDSTALRAAECASVGGVWFAWQSEFDPDATEPRSDRYDLTSSIDEALRRVSELAEKVQSSIDHPQDSDRYFTQTFRWEARSPLERQILNYLTAPIDGRESRGSVETEILEALSAEFGVPLPIIADAVANILRGYDNRSSPVRKPVDSPSSAVAVEPQYEREHVYA